MPLISSSRHTEADLREWGRLEAFDAILARSPLLARKEKEALAAIRSFAAQGPCYVGVSWGKDSVVVAHLAIRAGVGPLVWFSGGRIENPDCRPTRDAFIAMFPRADYREVQLSGAADAVDVTGHDGGQREFEAASRAFGDRYISGVRAEESKARSLRMAKWGPSTENTCAPIGWWKGEDVFAYLHKHSLPVHPAYAMTFGGVLDRKRVRVGSIGGYRGTGRGRREWERHYYRDELEALEDGS